MAAVRLARSRWGLRAGFAPVTAAIRRCSVNPKASRILGHWIRCVGERETCGQGAHSRARYSQRTGRRSTRCEWRNRANRNQGPAFVPVPRIGAPLRTRGEEVSSPRSSQLRTLLRRVFLGTLLLASTTLGVRDHRKVSPGARQASGRLPVPLAPVTLVPMGKSSQSQ